jgi:hypothetical protein
MTRKKLTTILGVVLAFACGANASFAQTQATTTNATQTSGIEGQSAAAMAQEASNPFASSWALQVQQNNNWTEMPRGDDHTRVQSNLMFQPLLSLRLTENQPLIIRPVVTMVNSIPYFDRSGQNQRTDGFGDTVLAFALPRSLFGGRLTVGAGPTFIFPTASQDLLSQDTWQLGPDAGGVLLGKHFIAYAFVQQWFKIGGDGRDTNQMSGTIKLGPEGPSAVEQGLLRSFIGSASRNYIRISSTSNTSLPRGCPALPLVRQRLRDPATLNRHFTPVSTRCYVASKYYSLGALL